MSKLIVKILIVTEEEGSFDPSHRFGLSELTNTLKTAVYDFAEFHVTTAHRSLKSKNVNAALADLENFRFDSYFSIAQYHQVWLFGFSNYYNIGTDPFVQATPTGEVFPLSDAELVKLSEFMDAGGGVFATGDHENLGINLCGRIPRVKSMRRWEFDYKQVENSYNDYKELGTDAPPVFGVHAHDTLVAGHNDVYEFDDQSDDVPQKISPKIYASGSRYIYRTYPHPILCSSKGMIDVLPDHMHEGQCQVPNNLTQNISILSYNKPEYPFLNGFQEIPEVIAWGFVQGGHAVPLPFGFDVNSQKNFKNANNSTSDDSFGNICVYDGHQMNIGRVVVDSTFHHFVNINLIGVKEAPASYVPSDDSKKVGFQYSAEGREVFEKIKTYYRNIALYLMTDEQLQSTFYRILWRARFDSQLKMLTPNRHKLSIRNYDHWMFYGKSVLETLQRQLTTCMALHVTISAIDPLALLCPVYFNHIHLPDPPPDYLNGIDRGEFLYVTLANIMVNLKERSAKLNENEFKEIQRSMKELVISARNESLHLLGNLDSERHQQTQRYMAFVGERYLKENLRTH